MTASSISDSRGLRTNGTITAATTWVWVSTSTRERYLLDGTLAILPQHLTVPSARSPHIVELPEDDAPLEMALKIPVAGSDCKKSLLPQQAIVPSVLSPHAWDSPTDTALNEPDGALVILPQHLTVPPACSPQE